MSGSIKLSRRFPGLLASRDGWIGFAWIGSAVCADRLGWMTSPKAGISVARPQRRLAWLRAALSSFLLGSGLVFAALASDASRPDSATLRFQIPEQSLVTALQAYSSVSGVAVLYESGVVSGQRSVVVDGEYTRAGALKVLLGKTDLVARYARADAITLADPMAASPDTPPEMLFGSVDMVLDTLHVSSAASGPDRNALADYIGTIQKDIQRALKTKSTRSTSYRVGLDLWVDPSRTVRRTEVFRSTGDLERDVAISAALQGLVFRQPAPARTPQPVRVMIDVRAM